MKISRRTVLWGLGTSIALPWLNAMEPVSAAVSGNGVSPLPGDHLKCNLPRRVAFVYTPNGIISDKWFPQTVGRDFDLPSSLEPLKNVKDDLVVVSGLDRTFIAGSDPHSQCGSCWMTSSSPEIQLDGTAPTHRTLDQFIASQYAGSTPFQSLELSCNSFTDNRESTNFDAISWYGPGFNARSERNPISVFRRLFGKPKGLDQSVLDAVVGQANALHGRLGADDRQIVSNYLESIRSIEKRVEIQKQNVVRLEDFGLTEPAAVPSDRGEYIRLMIDLMLLAFQTDSTRVASLMVGPERWATPQLYPGVFDKPVDHHTMTHDAGFSRELALIDRFHISQIAYMIEKMKSTMESNGQSILDNTLLVAGAGLGNGGNHSYKDLPLLLAGTSVISVEPGRHVHFSEETPLANFWLMLGNRLGLDMDQFADSTGELTL